MKTKSHPRRAFTLVELLTVIAIIAILASMTLAVLAIAARHAKVVKAKTEMAELVNAISAFESDYGRYPVTTNEQVAAGANDFTTGMMASFGTAPKYSYDNNSNVVAILMDLEHFPNGSATVNLGHVKNPKQVIYLTAKPSGYDPSTGGIGLPGVDNTGIYRDPWGNPYVITMDLNYDSQCSDLLYSLAGVSQNPPSSTSMVGFNGLSNPGFATTPDNFQFHGKVMVWSAGSDGQYDMSPANAGKNRDNVLSWQ